MTGVHTYKGGCLCGGLRYEAHGKPQAQGYCMCRDCRKASGSGVVPFLLFAPSSVRFEGETKQSVVKSFRGSNAVRNRCATCGGLVFGGPVGTAEFHTLYAGSLDEPSLFRPTMAIFAREQPDWVLLPPELEVFATLPGM